MIAMNNTYCDGMSARFLSSQCLQVMDILL